MTICDTMDYSTPGLSVPHYLQEFAQVHVHGVSGAIQSSHPLPPPSPFAFSLSQHQDLPVNRLLALGCQSIAASASSVLLMSIQG